MAKRPTVPCTGCGRLTWHTEGRGSPPDQRVCRLCRRHGRRRAALWRLDRAAIVDTVVLEPCQWCSAMPAVAATFPDTDVPRAITWSHTSECSTLSEG